MSRWSHWKEKQRTCEIYYSKPLDEAYQYWNKVLADISSKFCLMEGSVLDVGCGDPVRSLKYFSGEYFYIGLDPNVENPETVFPLIVGVGEFLPFRSGVFNHVALMSILDHVANPRLCMEEAERVLRRGGCLWAMLLIWLDGFGLERDEYHLKHFSIDDLSGILPDLQYQYSLSVPYKEDFRRVLFLKLRKRME